MAKRRSWWSNAALRQAIALTEGGRGLRSLFGATDTGFLFDSMRTSILFQDTAATTPIAADSDPVGRANDQSGLGNNAVQATGTKRPFWFSNAGKPYIKGDAVDDSLNGPWVPTSAGAIAIAIRPFTTSEISIGSKATSDRAFIGTDAAGKISAGIATVGQTVIFGGSDARGVDTVAIVTWNGTTVTLWRDGVSIYSGAQVGTVASAQGVSICALNNNGTVGSFSAARVYAAMGISRVPSATEIALITSQFQRTYQ